MDLKGLFLVGMVDGLIVAAPLVGVGWLWPEYRGLLWALAIAMWVGGFLATFMGATMISGNDHIPERPVSYRVDDELE